VIHPRDLLARLDLKEGDLLQVVEQPEHGFKLRPFDPKRAEVMRIGREVMDEYEDTFRELAK
jgi:bifunctional DNA-binding transcriptional regulator/antitoxin component of YhaV-PrlF toxin-antitoxin module